ncbi:sterol desaturase family [Geopyxis carbonaria]|nr:sterol desaturase family [Geopyxis carbonaria]
MFDMLVTLSGLSLLFTSSTSWSTSLNLLFFYLTWSTLLLSHPPIRIELAGTLIIRILFFWTPALLFQLFDSLLPSLARNIKLRGAGGIAPGGQRLRVLGWALFNTLLGVAAQGAVEYSLTTGMGRKSALRIASTLPMPGEILWGVLRAVLLRELSGYYIHRVFLHGDGMLARLHNRWQMGVKAPWSTVAHYDHPIVYLVARWLPIYAPAVLFRFHLLTWYLFLAIVSVEEVTTYSGYSTVYSMLGGATKRTDRHFAKGGKGNFAPWGVLDWIHGTSAGGDTVVEDVKEAVKENGKSE